MNPRMRRTACLLIATGIFLRLNHYFDNPSFWANEAWFAVDILTRTAKDILFHQNISPNYSIPMVGFSLLERGVIHFLGIREFAFRLFPLLAGIASVVLYYRMLKDRFPQVTAVTALAFFVFSGQLIFYSAQLKQYSSDVFLALVLYGAVFHFENRQPTGYNLCALGLLGLLAAYFSLPAVFILAGLASGQTLSWLMNRQDTFPKKYFFSFCSWGIGFLFIWWFYYRGSPLAQNLGKYHEANFMPLPLWSKDCWRWLAEAMLGIFKHTAVLQPAFLAMALFMAGCFVAFKKEKRLLLQLTMIVFFTLLASGLKKYPFYGRFLLFLVPLIYLFIGSGINSLMSRNRVFLAGGLLIFGVLIIAPVSTCAYHMLHPRTAVEIRPLLAYLKNHQLPGDEIYMNNEAQFSYLYYQRYFHFPYVPHKRGFFSDSIFSDEGGAFCYIFHNDYGFDSRLYASGPLLPGKVNPQKHNLTELELGERTWVLFAQAKKPAQAHCLQWLGRKGRQVDEVRTTGAALYLFHVGKNQ